MTTGSSTRFGVCAVALPGVGAALLHMTVYVRLVLTRGYSSGRYALRP